MNVKLYGELIEDGSGLPGLSQNVDRLSSFAYNLIGMRALHMQGAYPAMSRSAF